MIAWLQKVGWIGGLVIIAVSSIGVVRMLLLPKPWPRSLTCLVLLLVVTFGLGWATLWGGLGRKLQWSHRKSYTVAAFSFMLVGFVAAAKGGFGFITLSLCSATVVGALARKIAHPELGWGSPPPEPPVQLHIT
jgi:hypothetical protein